MMIAIMLAKCKRKKEGWMEAISVSVNSQLTETQAQTGTVMVTQIESEWSTRVVMASLWLDDDRRRIGFRKSVVVRVTVVADISYYWCCCWRSFREVAAPSAFLQECGTGVAAVADQRGSSTKQRSIRSIACTYIAKTLKAQLTGNDKRIHAK